MALLKHTGDRWAALRRFTNRAARLKMTARSGRGLLTAAMVALLEFTAVAGPAVRPVASKEYQVKAVFLLNFLQFMEWPAGAFDAPDAPVQLGVLGDDPFGSALDEAIRGETVRGRPIVLKRSRRWQDLRNCHLVFISGSERARVAEILAAFGDAPVITVGEVTDFARRGGTIRFYLDGNKVRFEINPVSAQRGGVKLSTQLLSVARVLPPESPKQGE